MKIIAAFCTLALGFAGGVWAGVTDGIRELTKQCVSEPGKCSSLIWGKQGSEKDIDSANIRGRNWYMRVFYGVDEEEGPVRATFSINFDKDYADGKLKGSYDLNNGRSKGELIGLERPSFISFAYASTVEGSPGRGYVNANLKSTAGSDAAYVGWALVLACQHRNTNECNVNEGQYKLCRAIISTTSTPETLPVMKQYIDKPCVAFPGNVNADVASITPK